jgi:hypothetical protein
MLEVEIDGEIYEVETDDPNVAARAAYDIHRKRQQSGRIMPKKAPKPQNKLTSAKDSVIAGTSSALKGAVSVVDLFSKGLTSTLGLGALGVSKVADAAGAERLAEGSRKVTQGLYDATFGENTGLAGLVNLFTPKGARQVQKDNPVTSAIIEGGFGAVTGLGASAIASKIPNATANVVRLLAGGNPAIKTSRVVAEVSAGAAAGAAGEIAKQEGLGPVGQIAASLFAGVGAGAAAASAPSAARNLGKVGKAIVSPREGIAAVTEAARNAQARGLIRNAAGGKENVRKLASSLPDSDISPLSVLPENQAADLANAAADPKRVREMVSSKNIGKIEDITDDFTSDKALMIGENARADVQKLVDDINEIVPGRTPEDAQQLGVQAREAFEDKYKEFKAKVQSAYNVPAITSESGVIPIEKAVNVASKVLAPKTEFSTPPSAVVKQVFDKLERRIEEPVSIGRPENDFSLDRTGVNYTLDQIDMIGNSRVSQPLTADEYKDILSSLKEEADRLRNAGDLIQSSYAAKLASELGGLGKKFYSKKYMAALDAANTLRAEQGRIFEQGDAGRLFGKGEFGSPNTPDAQLGQGLIAPDAKGQDLATQLTKALGDNADELFSESLLVNLSRANFNPERVSAVARQLNQYSALKNFSETSRDVIEEVEPKVLELDQKLNDSILKNMVKGDINTDAGELKRILQNPLTDKSIRELQSMMTTADERAAVRNIFADMIDTSGDTAVKKASSLRQQAATMQRLGLIKAQDMMDLQKLADRITKETKAVDKALRSQDKAVTNFPSRVTSSLKQRFSIGSSRPLFIALIDSVVGKEEVDSIIALALSDSRALKALVGTPSNSDVRYVVDKLADRKAIGTISGTSTIVGDEDDSNTLP